MIETKRKKFKFKKVLNYLIGLGSLSSPSHIPIVARKVNSRLCYDELALADAQLGITKTVVGSQSSCGLPTSVVEVACVY